MSDVGDLVPAGPLFEYRARIASKELKHDPAQALAVEKLQSLFKALQAYQRQSGQMGWKERFGLGRRREDPPQGLYFYGGVGRGKSMLMDMFYEDAPVKRKRRVHFHAFMQQVHIRLNEYRKFKGREADPIPPIAEQLANEATLLCFDEFQVTDIADAMILSRLFEVLFEEGVVVVSTSNRPPQDLYKDGLQREKFLPFIDLIEDKMDVLQLDGRTDYRLEHLKQLEVFLYPDDEAARQKLDEAFETLTHGARPHAASIPVQGRDVAVPKAAQGVAMVAFEDICGRPLGPADYLELSRRFHTIIIPSIPEMGPDNKDVARRFVTLIDAMYEGHVKLICSADVGPMDLYNEGEGSFEFERTASRLVEMQSESYMQRQHAKRVG
ncbi:cell division protein ZapE [Magnetovibrio sp. PR-2]|uniref:cell division protein ZapE n=1 Tax=Magnetovibrio sp. PR-2 TaxID=3120356 RepID=UPI002FCE344A